MTNTLKGGAQHCQPDLRLMVLVNEYGARLSIDDLFDRLWIEGFSAEDIREAFRLYIDGAIRQYLARIEP